MAMAAGYWLLKGAYWIDTDELVGAEMTVREVEEAGSMWVEAI